MNNYPYPVLTYGQSAYKDAYYELSCNDWDVRDGNVILSFSMDLSSATLNELIHLGKAKVIIKATSEILSKTFEIEGNADRAVLRLEGVNLKTNDIISVTAYIVAKESFDYLWNEELRDYYPRDLKTHIRKNDVLAISNTDKFDYTVLNTDFIKIRCSDEQEGKGPLIRLSNDNYIEIVVGRSLNHAYAVTKSDQRISSIFGSHLVFEAFVFVLIDIIQNKDEHMEKEWFRLFSNLLQSVTGDDVDEMIQKVKDESIDLNQVYEIANSLINNQIENSLIRASRETEA